ncbi:MAG: flagellar hook capping FlgD N-terminal domain-containing protein [Pseudomonadota bacterium]
MTTAAELAAGVSTPQTTTGTTSSRTAAEAQNQFDDDFETFLTLLTTQLQNQDPTNPMDTNEFTQQLVSYSALEQDINQNQALEELVSLMGSFVNSSAISYVGDRVTIDGTRAQLQNGVAEWGYDVARNGSSGSIEIRDANGALVRTAEPQTQTGSHSFRWDGRMDNGQVAPDGDYFINISVQDSTDVAVPVTTSVDGLVEEVDLSTNPPTLVVNGQNVPLDAIQAVRPNN